MTLWSAEQQRLLQAMGYVLYTQTSASPTIPVPQVVANAVEASTTEFSRLLRSLQLAAMGRDVSPLIADVAALRGDARAKRALWPKLRALRRPH